MLASLKPASLLFTVASGMAIPLWQAEVRGQCNPPPPASITVTSPNGGEVYAPGVAQTITWTSSGPVNNLVFVYYSPKGGSNWSMLTLYGVPNTGTLYWTPPCTESSNYIVRVDGSFVCGGISDQTDGLFSVDVDAFMTVSSPAGGESLLVGATAPINWTSDGPVNSNVAIHYSINSGSTWTPITTSTPNDGSLDWMVPNSLTTQGMIRVTATNSCTNQPVVGLSGLFSIVTTCDDETPCTLDAFVQSLGRCLNLPQDCFECDDNEECDSLPVPCLECVRALGSQTGHCVPALRTCNQRPEQCKYKFYDCFSGYCLFIDWCPEGLCCENGECKEPPCMSNPRRKLLLNIIEGGLGLTYNQAQDFHSIGTSPPNGLGLATGTLRLPGTRAGWEYLGFEYQYIDPSSTENASLAFADTLLWVAPAATEPGAWERAVVPVGDYAGMTGALTFMLSEGAEPSSSDMLMIRNLTLFEGAELDSVPGDLNGDDDLDFADLIGFPYCITGPDGGVSSGCEPADVEPDDDVDLADFAVIQGVMQFDFGDFDGDGDVDLADAEAFLDCLSGPEAFYAPGCTPADGNADGDADLADFAAFQIAFGQ